MKQPCGIQDGYLCNPAPISAFQNLHPAQRHFPSTCNNGNSSSVGMHYRYKALYRLVHSLDPGENGYLVSDRAGWCERFAFSAIKRRRDCTSRMLPKELKLFSELIDPMTCREGYCVKSGERAGYQTINFNPFFFFIRDTTRCSNGGNRHRPTLYFCG